MRLAGGIDPSLSSAGIAVVTLSEPWSHETEPRVTLATSVFKTPPTGNDPADEVDRVSKLVADLCGSVWSAELVYIESPALASRTGKAGLRFHLYYALIAALVQQNRPFRTLTPGALKKRVTGNGRADKEEVLDAVRAAWGDRGWEDGLKGGRYDRADAAALAWIAAEAQGFPVPVYPHARALPRAA